MSQGVLVEIVNGWAHITFTNPVLRGPALNRLLALGAPIKSTTGRNNTHSYRVPQQYLKDAGLLDTPHQHKLFPVAKLATPTRAVGVSRPAKGRVILFVFAGRRANMELQLPYIERILAENPQVEYHVWDLARWDNDSKFLRSIQTPRTQVRTEFAKLIPGFDHVYRHYCHPQYNDAVFVKLDDDIVFLQTERFGDFVRAVQDHPHGVMSAHVINNGACASVEPALFAQFSRLGISRLDVHTSAAFASLSHNYFFRHYPRILDVPVEVLAPTPEWLSINVIGYTWEMGRRIAALTGTAYGTKRNPRIVAGRAQTILGDEGAVNTLTRHVVNGFTACHLTFGPQDPGNTQLQRWRQRYAQMAEYALARELVPEPVT